MADLPFIDEHHIVVDSTPATAWATLLEAVDGAFSGSSAFASVLGCQNTTTSGRRPLATGSTLPGFHVARAMRERELSLEGRHRFSTYALTFRLEPVEGNSTSVTAESRAAFPGVHGRLYRTAVIRSGAHAHLLRRLLLRLQPQAPTTTRP